jgi:transcriptional regulator with XRE-family HTH domain
MAHERDETDNSSDPPHVTPILGTGSELRRYRQAAGLSLAELAERVHYSKGYLSKIENGLHPPGIELLRLCDAVLGADGKLVARAQRSPEPMPSVDESEMWVMGMAGDGTGWAIPMRRRDAVVAGLSSWIGLRVAPVTAPANLEPAVRGFHAMFEQSRALGHVAAPGLVLPVVIAQTQAVRGMAATAAGTPEQAPLLRLAARFAEFTGWMAQEAGDDRVALGWTRTAVELADAAGDRELGAHALVRQALIALYQEDPGQTVELARRARAEAEGSARVRGFAALREAQGQALLGDHDACRRALDEGRAALASGTGAGGTLALGPTSVPDMASVVTGWCLHDLGRADDAIEVLLPQLRAMPADTRRSRARFGVRLVLAYLGAGAVDEGCQLLDELLDDVGMVDSATVRHDLRRVYRALPRWRSHPHAQDLHARLPGLLRVNTMRL